MGLPRNTVDRNVSMARGAAEALPPIGQDDCAKVVATCPIQRRVLQELLRVKPANTSDQVHRICSDNGANSGMYLMGSKNSWRNPTITM
jgi:hypothetical protein